ncbi:MAG TPA: nucleotidyltransferase [Ignavibacteria bacterium]|nr:nucleotidyltransferase [Ignavibacteria bacterium]
MVNKKEIRWKQRFFNFEKAFNLLARTLNIKSPSEAEKGGVVQFYEVCFELSWKIMKDYLESEGYIVKSPKQAIKLAFQTELISDGETWLSALEDRNLTAHTYDEATTDAIINKIRNSYFGLIEGLFNKLKVINEQ